MLGASLCLLAAVGAGRLHLPAALSNSSVEVQLLVLGYDDDVFMPYVEDMDPASGATLVPVSTNVAFHIKDFRNNDGVTSGSGVDLSSIVVTIWHGNTVETYQDGDAEFTASGIVVNRLITIDRATDFANNTRVTVAVEASDLHVPANVMSLFRYSFLTVPAAGSSSSAGTGGSAVDDPRGGHRGTRDQQILDNLHSDSLDDLIRDRCLPGTSIFEKLFPQWGDRVGCDEVELYPGPPQALTPFPDVPAGAWYEKALANLLQKGVVDRTQPLFRPADGTLRAELATMLVRLAGIQPESPLTSYFADVFPGTWYYAFVEEAAVRGWMIGYGDCYLVSRPCEDRPAVPVTRAEAAKMIVRYGGLKRLGLAPEFADMPPYAWYVEPIRIAADHCILQGVGGTNLVDPERLVTRAELVTMLDRAEQGLQYGVDCRR